jgi:hypothetical protein
MTTRPGEKLCWHKTLGQSYYRAASYHIAYTVERDGQKWRLDAVGSASGLQRVEVREWFNTRDAARAAAQAIEDRQGGAQSIEHGPAVRVTNVVRQS